MFAATRSAFTLASRARIAPLRRCVELSVVLGRNGAIFMFFRNSDVFTITAGYLRSEVTRVIVRLHRPERTLFC